MLLYLNSYKGKYHIYADDDDEMYGSVGTVESETLTDADLFNHAAACGYYGIPMYTGADEAFNKRCDDAWDRYEEQGNLLDMPSEGTESY